MRRAVSFPFPTISLLLTTILLLALLPAQAPATPPTLQQIQQAITDQGLDWDARSNNIWTKTWAQKDSLQGCLISGKRDAGFDAYRFLPAPFRRDLPDSFTWRDKDDTNYISSVKNQGNCGSCWAFAGCGVVEAMRKIKGYTTCGHENLSEQHLVSCNTGVGGNLGCGGGYPDRTANYLQNTGTPDEGCFPYKAKQLPCALRCVDWASRVRKISSWSYVRNGGSVTTGTVDSLKNAVYGAPQWITMYVYEDFYAYDGGVYEYATGDRQGGHAIMLVGYNDADSCFIVKNSWGTDWGEGGFFRIHYNQVAGDVEFGKWTITYNMDPAEDDSVDDSFCYSATEMGYVPLSPGQMQVISADEQVALVPVSSFTPKYYCAQLAGPINVSSNGWICMGGGKRTDPWPMHSPIPSPEGPGSMIAPLWTDLEPMAGGGVFATESPEGLLLEYRNMIHKDAGTLENFTVVIWSPDYMPTRTGGSVIWFNYTDHEEWCDYHTVGIENHAEVSGVQVNCDGVGLPIHPMMQIEFAPVPKGDEYPAAAPGPLVLSYLEPWVNLEWTNPTQDTEGWTLDFIDGVIIERDGDVLADLEGGEPGEVMTYQDRDPGDGWHDYTVYAYAGTATGEPATEPIEVPARTDYRDHDINDALFTVTDQGICGFMAGDQAQGSGFCYGPSGANQLFLGSLWAGTSETYALNRDYDDDPYADWLYRQSFQTYLRLGDQEHFAACDDAGHPYSRGLFVDQHSWAFGEAPYDDFVIVEYTLRNEGEETIGGLYVGQFMDYDVSETDPWTDQASSDAGLRLAYMWHDETLPYVGVALLDSVPPPDAPPAANLAVVHNPTYVYPNAYLGDADRYLFLSGGDPDHSVGTGWEPNDWSVMVSDGPFELAPHDTLCVAFAMLGGEDLPDLIANTIQAYYAYRGGGQDVAEDGQARWQLRLDPNRPNPFAFATTIRYALPRRAPVELVIYDAAGRAVRTLIEGTQEAGIHQVAWDGRNEAGRQLPCGVYFYRLNQEGGQLDRRMVIVR